MGEYDQGMTILRKLIAVVVLVFASIGCVAAVDSTPAHAWTCSISYAYYPSGGQYLGSAANFQCSGGPYTWVRAITYCSGSGAPHYGLWVTGWSTSTYKCWPGTHATAWSAQLAY